MRPFMDDNTALVFLAAIIAIYMLVAKWIDKR
jgi:hypothetical protein